MGWHTDLKYSKKGLYSHKQNCQVENTPTVIITVGMERILKWRQVCFDAAKKTNINKDWCLEMLMKEGILTILHPMDECPHWNTEINKYVKYEHGNVNIKKGECSVAFVFRMVKHKYHFTVKDNLMHKKDQGSLNETTKQEYDKMYSKIDIQTYHQEMLDVFSCIIEDFNNIKIL